MKKRKLVCLIALVLAVILLAGTVLSVGAARTVSDVNGDGKITVFDAQLIAESNASRRELTDTQSSSAKGITIADIMNYVFGDTTVDAGDTDGDGIHEIYTAEGLQVLHTVSDGHFILMNDLDLDGADWTPVQNFSGTLEGNGHTISNFTISTSVVDSRSSVFYNLGFFGDTTTAAVISDLHLRDVTVTADTNATGIGFFAGTLRGQLTGCTVIGTLKDTRETYPANVYTGVMAGRLASGTEGSIVGGTGLSYADELGKYTTEGLCANVKLFITNDELNVVDGKKNKVGLAGYAPSSYTVTGQWVDTSYSSSLLSETIQARQSTVVDYMNAMASVQWTPAEDWTYTATNGTDQVYKAGTVYTGLPYNGHNGSLERFLSVMASQDENGVYTSVSGLGSGGWEESAVVKNYVRLYTVTNSSTGVTTGYLQKPTSAPTEVITFDTASNTLCYSTETDTYYLGATDTNENLHVTGTAVSQLPAHLYTISNGNAVLVTTPVVGTTYKLGMQNVDGTIMFFNGEMISVGGVACLATTAELEDAQDVYLETVSGGYHLYFETAGDWSDSGFYLTMGNDCSGAVNWAWMQVSNVIVSDTASHLTPYKGGVYIVTTNYMIPNDTNRVSKGVYQVGSWEASTTDPETGKWVSAEFDASLAAYQCTTETYSPEVLISNGIDTILEAYAQTHKADAVVCYVSKWSSRVNNGGHSRLVVADPVVIRNADGSIDSTASYMLLTEQGVGFTAGSTSTWNIAKKHTFYALTGNAVEGSVTTATKTYLPITMRALHEDNIRETYITGNPKGSITSPVSGGIYTYNHINSVTVTVTDASGKVYYDNEAFTGISTAYNTYRGRNNDIKMADLHGDAFYAAAKANSMVEGNTYYFSVDVLLSTGEVVHLITKASFTYTAE